MNLRVILADDHPFVLLGVRSSIELQRDVSVVGEATNATSLIRLLKNTECDVLVTDLSMPDAEGEVEDGLALVKKVQSEWPSIHIVVLTGTTNMAIVRSLLVDGVSGMISKTESLHVISTAIRCATKGCVYVSQSLMMPILIPAGDADEDGAPFARLSDVQARVVGMILQGRSLEEVATYFGRNVRAIRRVRRSAMLRLGVKSSPELFLYASRNGLI
ncbi:response regulator transcription factor [Paraburkholderia bonniea]|uniref:response regulator transcription factor n=1 Tax=Paraburkholderia bonniea TaxID=2152891 RepID=UPI0015806973|nr:response regulator transcription factor [Paraburkholderia bonniea]WJF90673.1 response regulator transcription factor [Paraburkholderia bonniea]WJF93987.1 response regulator transcription factor [Paraburkholderia bonniea]